jgi:hypothetical protein
VAPTPTPEQNEVRNQECRRFVSPFRLGYEAAGRIGEAITPDFRARRLRTWDRRFESPSPQRRVRSEPRSGRSHLGPGQAVDLVDDHDVDRAGLRQALLEARCPTMQRSAVCRLELADGAPTRLSMPFEAKRRNKPTSNRPNAPGGG